MKHSRLTILCAILALAAWVNTQAMVCCWFPCGSKAVSAKVEMTSALSGQGHECCQRASISSASTTPVSVPSGVAAISSLTHGSCGQYDAQVSESFTTVSLHLALVPERELPGEIVQAPSHFLSAVPFDDSGPPHFLTLRRLLI